MKKLEKHLDKKQLILFSILIVIIFFIIGLVASIVSDRLSDNVTITPSDIIPSVGSIDEWNSLTPELRQDYFLQSVWGEDYKENYVEKFITSTPWSGVDLSHFRPDTLNQLELMTMTVYNFNPVLLIDGETYIVDVYGSDIDLKKNIEVYTGINFQFDLSKQSSIISGYRNGSYFKLTFVDEKLYEE